MAHILSPNDLMSSGQSGYFSHKISLIFPGNLICTLVNNGVVYMMISCGKWHPEKLNHMLIMLRYCDVSLSTHCLTSSTLRHNHSRSIPKQNNDAIVSILGVRYGITSKTEIYSQLSA